MEHFDYNVCKLCFDKMPIAFTIIEILLNDKHEPIDFIFRYANQAHARLEEVDLENMLGHRFYKELFPEKHDKKWLRYYYSSAFQGKNHELHEYSAEIDKYLKIICYPWHIPGYCACVLMDETDLVEVQRQLNFLAGYDAATRVQNRNSYVEFCGNLENNGSVGVVFVDANNLKLTNDTYGHDMGDYLLQLIVERINSRFAKGEANIFRIGGDEFVVILNGISKKSCREKIMALRQDFKNSELVHLPKDLAAVGWSWTSHLSSIEDLVREADKDMYIAKQMSRQ
ncbi:GGDEF domain-containing protein [Clostridium transplantifaecale]|uniref:GGDEF domain-containing protein n=1 Tax=Clostridium transplantifaecale TaxID=2479838 RepID=UPI000F62D4D5|nr:GGDEF domain-containing protein [Clostridium transplantifaecale]